MKFSRSTVSVFLACCLALSVTQQPALAESQLARCPDPDEALGFLDPATMAAELDPVVIAAKFKGAPRLFVAIAEAQPRSRTQARVKAILAQGDDPNQCGPFGLTPLQMAAAGGREDVIQLLLSHGARLEAPLSSSGGTALGAAIVSGHWKTAQLLLGSGASAKTIDAYGESVLHTLAFQARDAKAEKAKEALILQLIERGAPVNQRNAQGYTPLMIAALINNPAVVKLLLANGADTALRNTKQQTAADLAKLRGHKAILELLR